MKTGPAWVPADIHEGSQPALSPGQIADLRRARAAGARPVELAELYGISLSTVHRYVRLLGVCRLCGMELIVFTIAARHALEHVLGSEPSVPKMSPEGTGHRPAWTRHAPIARVVELPREYPDAPRARQPVA